MKSFLVTTSAPFCGTDRYYAAYAENEDNIYDYLYAHWFDEECQSLWDNFSYLEEDQWEAEWEEMDEDEKEEVYDNSYDNFMDAKYEEWASECGLSIKEVDDEEDLKMYTVGGEELPEILYDERNEK